jgi:hypothetical protein
MPASKLVVLARYALENLECLVPLDSATIMGVE